MTKRNIAEPKRAQNRAAASTPEHSARRSVAKRASSERGQRRRQAEHSQGAERLGCARDLIRNVPDFPKPGIQFKDITPLLADPKGLSIVIDSLVEHFIGDPIDAIVGIESRGFIFGGALAARLNTSFVPVRKPGKLPASVDCVAYSLEYGTAQLEMHKHSLRRGARVVIIDDLLATGGTAAATAQLVRRQGGTVAAYAFVIELTFLDGRAKLGDTPVLSLIRYSGEE